MSNVFSFTGTVGRDAEVRFTPAGMAVLNVTVANNVGFGDNNKLCGYVWCCLVSVLKGRCKII